MATTSVINRGAINSAAINASDEAFDFGTWDVALASDSSAAIEHINSSDIAVVSDTIGLLLFYTSTIDIAISVDVTESAQSWTDSKDVIIGSDTTSSTLRTNENSTDIGYGLDSTGALLLVSSSVDLASGSSVLGFIEWVAIANVAIGVDSISFISYTDSIDTAIVANSETLYLIISSATTDIGIGADTSNPYGVGVSAVSAYVVHSDTGAVSSYILPKTVAGLMAVNGLLYIATSNGLYVVDAADDAGNEIVWRLKTGFSNFGNELLKRVPDVDILARISGDVHLRTITSRSGVKRSDTFRKPVLTAEAHRDGVIKIGYGLQSVYWQFVVEGQGFADIDEFVPNIIAQSGRRR